MCPSGEVPSVSEAEGFLFLCNFQICSFIAFMKKSISGINNGAYFERYFSSNSRRPYTFSIGLPYPVFEKEKISLSKNEWSMIFSTGDKLTGYIFIRRSCRRKIKIFRSKTIPCSLFLFKN